MTAWGSDTHITDVAEIEGLTALHEVPGYVWCSKYEEIHGDTLNPRSYIEDGKQDYCKPEEHDALFRDADHNVPRRQPEVVPKPTPGSVLREDVPMSSPKGEYSGVEAEQVLSGLTPGGSCRVTPEPVRSIPTPLTVRRHTEESRAIWRANLVAALPVDMPTEDRYAIADQLLEVTIDQGNKMRRSRLINLLLTAAEDMEDLHPSRCSFERLHEWSHLMADAAEEIQSVL